MNLSADPQDYRDGADAARRKSIQLFQKGVRLRPASTEAKIAQWGLSG